MAEKLLQVKDLKTYFFTDEGVAKAVDGISFDINCGETVGLVGESGCGKSVTSLSIMRLLKAYRFEGEILLEDQDLMKASNAQLSKLRGKDIGMIFQDPMTSLDPVFTIEFQMRETILKHHNMTREEAHQLAVSLFEQVGIPDPEATLKRYPHELSGGQRQRVMIAMAMTCDTKLLIADEPTTALDVTIQAQILKLMRKIKEEKGNSILLITHDLGVVAELCDRVIVMYCGKIVESGTVRQIFYNPLHQYTKALLSSIPSIDGNQDRLSTIKGVVPSITALPTGCRFHPRCEAVCEKCSQEYPEMIEAEPGHFVACHLVEASPVQ